MSLPKEKLHRLLEMVVATQNDTLDCDGCLEHIAHYVEVHLEGLSLSEQLAAVKRHLESCVCCLHEFEYLMRAIENIAENEANGALLDE